MRGKSAHDILIPSFQRKQCLRGKHWILPKFYVWKHYKLNFAALAMPFSAVVDVVVGIVVDIDVAVVVMLGSMLKIAVVVDNLKKDF